MTVDVKEEGTERARVDDPQPICPAWLEWKACVLVETGKVAPIC